MQGGCSALGCCTNALCRHADSARGRGGVRIAAGLPPARSDKGAGSRSGTGRVVAVARAGGSQHGCWPWGLSPALVCHPALDYAYSGGPEHPKVR
jgi:hypothetical protein